MAVNGLCSIEFNNNVILFVSAQKEGFGFFLKPNEYFFLFQRKTVKNERPSFSKCTMSISSTVTKCTMTTTVEPLIKCTKELNYLQLSRCQLIRGTPLHRDDLPLVAHRPRGATGFDSESIITLAAFTSSSSTSAFTSSSSHNTCHHPSPLNGLGFKISDGRHRRNRSAHRNRSARPKKK